jgi:PhnB protein
MAHATPPGFHTVTAGLCVRDTAKAIDFYEHAFGATELVRMAAPDGPIMHAEIKIGDSIVFLSDEKPEMGRSSPQTVGRPTGALYLYVENVDAAFKQAIDAGARELMAPSNMFWGDRFAQVADPFGHHWGLATRVEDVSPDEMERRGREFFAKTGQSTK